MTSKANVILPVLLLLLTSCSPSNSPSSSEIYTLYRNSLLDENMRIHISTFDALELGMDEKSEYNQENCWIVANLMGGRVEVKTRFWCEKGEYSE